MKTRKAAIVAAVSALLGSAAVTFVALRMMADNNNGEVYDTVTGQWEVGYLLKVLAIFYGLSFLLIFAIVFGLTLLWSRGANAS